MSFELQISRDRQGVLRAYANAPFEVLGGYLEQDIQASVACAEEVLTICSFIVTVGGKWTGTGNAHTVTISATGVRIENEFVEDASGICEMSLDDFRAAVEAWLRAVSAPW